MSQGDALDELQERIQKLKDEVAPKQDPVMSVHVAFSLGFSVLGALMVGDFFGRWLSEKAGNPNYVLVGWVLGFGLAGMAAHRLLRPYLN